MILIFALLLGKIVFLLTRVLKVGGGSAAPGYYALKLDSNLVKTLVKKIPNNIIITGTNGKTTTARLLSHFAKDQKIKVIRNHTGSNLERGIASTLISKANIFGFFRKVELGIWEVDEAAFNQLALILNPTVIVFLNIFRDQLDRYGEVDNVLKKWQETLKSIAPNATLLLNGDDQNILQLSKSFKGKSLIFGIKDYQIKGESLVKKVELQNYNFQANDVKPEGIKGTKFKLGFGIEQVPVKFNLGGIFNLYNFLAAFGAGSIVGLDPEKMIVSLDNYKTAFGRMEKLMVSEKEVFIILIKNPVGTTEVIKTISSDIAADDNFLIILNDNFADGTDISWIWDANFEVLQNSSRAKSRNFKFFVSGTRAEDMALRLKYAGFNPNQIIVEGNLKKALGLSLDNLKGKLFILPTYTAMLELQKVLTNLKIKAIYWEGE